MADTSPLPLAAIVGRPNVGKSQLFNRLVGRRVAVVHGEAGTTRDRIFGEVEWEGRRFQLVDTGGMIDPGTPLEEGMMKQLREAIAAADLCVLAVDAQAGLHPSDSQAAAFLRRTGKPVLVAAGKADNEDLRSAAGPEFSRLGFPEIYPVSAVHGLGTGRLLDGLAARLPAAAPPPLPPRATIALVGRPNVGKSTLANRILNEERVLVDSLPGTTRDAVAAAFTLEGRPWLLIDTAGVFRKPSSRSAVERYSLNRVQDSIARSDLVLLLLEKFQPPTRADAAIIHQALESGKGCVIGVNKWDLPGDLSFREYHRRLRGLLPYAGFIPLVFFSALTGQGVARLLEACEYVAAQRERKVRTPVLNRVVQLAQARSPLPSRSGKRPKIFYAVQVATAPPRFRLYVSHPRLVASSGRIYLINQIRRALGFEGVPLRLEFRAGRTDRSGEKS